MNELEKTLSTIIQRALEVAEKTGEFVIDQAPDLIQQFFNWHLTKNIILIVILLVVAIIAWIIFQKIGMKDRDKARERHYDIVCIANRYYEEALGIASIAIISIYYITTVILICIALYDICFILTAPKIYLIEYFLTK